MCEDKSRDLIILDHIDLGFHKSVSYLPLSTINNVFKIDIESIIALCSELKLSSEITNSDKSCLKSGSLHFFHKDELNLILKDVNEFSQKGGARTFIQKIARTWYEEADPMMPLIRAAFGDRAPSRLCEAHIRADRQQYRRMLSVKIEGLLNNK